MFMISSRHPLTILQKAAEIRVNSNDIARLADLISEKSNAAIVFYVPIGETIDWAKLNNYKELLNITIATEDFTQLKEIQEQGYKTYWAYPISTYWDLRSILKFNVSQIIINAPLFFELPEVKKISGNVELRATVNKCFNNLTKQETGICGTYIRPEDIDIYSQYISHFEFDTDSLEKELTLYRIYTQQKTWPGNLNLLLEDLNYSIDNRGFSALPGKDKHYFANRRINCGQRCQKNPNSCTFCTTVFNLITSIDRNAAYYDK